MRQALIDQNHGSESSQNLRNQDLIERILELAEHLPPQDRALLESVYKAGMAPMTIALASGQSRSRVCGKLRRLMRRLQSPLYQFAVRHRRDWPSERRAIAESVILRGQTQRATAAIMGLSLHQVRVELSRIEFLFERTWPLQPRRNETLVSVE